MKTRKIIRNMAKCRKCNTVAESIHRHHLSLCECGSIFVDGGTDYLRRGGNLENIVEMSESVEVETEAPWKTERSQ